MAAIPRTDNLISVTVGRELATAAAVGSDVSSLALGTIALADASLIAIDLSAASGGETVYFVQGMGTDKPVRKSLPMTLNADGSIPGLTVSSVTPFTLPDPQISYLGSNGTTGSMETTTTKGETFSATIVIQNNDELNRSQPTRKYIQTTSTSTTSHATQALFMNSLYANALKNFGSTADNYIKFERVNDTAATGVDMADTNATGDWVLTHGSKTVTMADSQDLAAGDWVRFSVGGTAGATDAVTDPVYMIASVDSGTQVTLDYPWQGDTATWNDEAVHSLTLGGEGVAMTGDWGIKMTSRPQTFSTGTMRDWKVNRFVVTLSDAFGTATVTTSQKANPGVGNYAEVAFNEYFAAGFDGQNANLIGVPPSSVTLAAQTEPKAAIAPLSSGQNLADDALAHEYKWRGYAKLVVPVSTQLDDFVTNNGTGKGLNIVYMEISDGTNGTAGDVNTQSKVMLAELDTIAAHGAVTTAGDSDANNQLYV